MMQVFAILALTVVLFLSERLPLDLVGILVLLALYLTGILTVEEALSGFSNSVVVTLAALFVVGGALFRTGVASRLGALLERAGHRSLPVLVTVIMVSAAVLSAFMSSTGTAAILIPAVVGVARSRGVSPSKLLLPLAYGCLIGGMLTLVGTPPNLVVQEALVEAGFKPFNFFSFAPMGLLVLAAAVVHMNLLGLKALPEGEQEEVAEDVSVDDLAQEYELGRHIFRVVLPADCPSVGKSLAELDLRGRFGLNVFGYQEAEDSVMQEGRAGTVLEAGYTVHLHGEVADAHRFSAENGLKLLPPLKDYHGVASGGGVTEVLLTPRSRLIGRTLRSSHFQERYRVNVLALKRRGQLIEDEANTRLKFGDTLLVAGRNKNLKALLAERGSFVVTGIPAETLSEGLRTEKAALAVALTVLMLALMTLNLLPAVIAVLLVAALALLSGCLSSEDAYRSISWQSLILIASMLPLALALEKTGGVEFIAGGLSGYLGGLGPQFVMVGLFLLTSTFSQFISNTATTVLVTPIAIQAARQLELDPHAFLMAVAVAASAAFVTPVASPVNMLVLSPGKYTFSDFVKVGLPLQLLVMVLAVLFLPLIFPLK